MRRRAAYQSCNFEAPQTLFRDVMGKSNNLLMERPRNSRHTHYLMGPCIIA